MSITGRYIWDEKRQKLVKISNKADVSPASYWCPDGGYIERNMDDHPVYIRDRRHKKQELEKRGLVEAG